MKMNMFESTPFKQVRKIPSKKTSVVRKSVMMTTDVLVIMKFYYVLLAILIFCFLYKNFIQHPVRHWDITDSICSFWLRYTCFCLNNRTVRRNNIIADLFSY